MSGVNISTHPEAGHAYNLEVGGSLSVPSGSIVFVFVFELRYESFALILYKELSSTIFQSL